jgi:hypothetical protein
MERRRGVIHKGYERIDTNRVMVTKCIQVYDYMGYRRSVSVTRWAGRLHILPLLIIFAFLRSAMSCTCNDILRFIV